MSDGTDLTLEGLTDEEVEAIIGGVSTLQARALAAGAVPLVNAAGSTLLKLAKQNPEAVRETLLSNQQSFQVINMPEELLEHLNLELRDGSLYEPDDEDGWTEVEIDE